MDLANEVLTGFKNACQTLLLQGFQRVRDCYSISPDAHEEDITSELVGAMDDFNEGPIDYPLYIAWESSEKSQYNLQTVETAKAAKRVDIILSRVRSGTTDYALECKRLKSSDRGTHRRYWNNGAMRFAMAKYADTQSFGAMVGYVLEGTISENENYVRAKSEDYISKLQLRGKWRHQDTLPDLEIYQTNHHRWSAPDITLDHYLLDFT